MCVEDEAGKYYLNSFITLPDTQILTIVVSKFISVKLLTWFVEVMAVTHHPMVIVDHNRVDVVVSTVVPQDR